MSLLSNSPIIRFYRTPRGFVNFGFAECETLDVAATPVYSACGRLVIYTVHTITMRAIVGQANQTAGTTTDGDMATMRAVLMQSGGEMHYEMVGYGPIVVNVPAAGPSIGSTGTIRAVEWGPRPQRLVWKPMGQQAAELTWTVQVALACEPTGPQQAQGILEWCWKWGVTLDQSGYGTRTYSGFARVGGTINPDSPRTLTDQADRLREQVLAKMPTPSGFRRVSQRFDLDESKTRLDFSVSDQEAGPAYPPAGVVVISASHSLEGSARMGVKWRGVIDAQIEMARDRQLATAEAVFWRIVQEKLDSARGKRYRSLGNDHEAKTLGLNLSYRVRDIYGKQIASFRYEYTLWTSLQALADASGVWKPLAGSGDWAGWKDSLAGTAFAARGNAGLRFNVRDETLIDLCLESQPPATPPPTSRPPTPPGGGTPSDRPRTDQPDPKGGWLDWMNFVTIVREDSVVELKPLPRPQLGGATPRPSMGRLASPNRFAGNREIVEPDPEPVGMARNRVPLRSATEEPDVQRRAAPTFYAVMWGAAFRAGAPAVAPRLVSVGGFPVVEANREGEGVTNGVIGAPMGTEIHFARWRIRYLIRGQYDDSKPVLPVVEG